MSDDRKHIDEPSKPLGEARADDTTVVMDEFVSPDDLVGEDMADELQRVLDEAQAGLNASADAAPIATPEARKDGKPVSDEDDGVFETPEEVISAEAGQPRVADETLATSEEVTRQLDAMNAVIQQALEPAEDAPVSATASMPASSDGQDSTEEFEDPSSLLASDPAAEKAAGARPTDDELSMLAQIQQMSQGDGATKVAPTPAPVAAADAPVAALAKQSAAEPPASATLGQLDEFLAGQADHAVADEFETVQDVLAVKPADAPVAAISPAPANQTQPAAEDDGDFDEPHAVIAEAAAVPAESSSSSPAVVPPPAPAPHTAMPAATPAPQRSKFAAMIHRSARSCRETAFKTCVLINRPMRRVSENTRKLVGYAGIITVANAALLILGKLILG